MSQLANRFLYQGKTFIKVVPVKSLFHSNLIHQVVTRGDVFAVNVDTHELTIIPGDAKIIPIPNE